MLLITIIILIMSIIPSAAKKNKDLKNQLTLKVSSYYEVFISNDDGSSPENYKIRFVDMDNINKFTIQNEDSIKSLNTILTQDKNSNNLIIEFRHIECNSLKLFPSINPNGFEFFFYTNEQKDSPQTRKFFKLVIDSNINNARNVDYFKGLKRRCLQANEQFRTVLTNLMYNMMNYDERSHKEFIAIVSEKYGKEFSKFNEEFKRIQSFVGFFNNQKEFLMNIKEGFNEIKWNDKIKSKIDNYSKQNINFINNLFYSSNSNSMLIKGSRTEDDDNLYRDHLRELYKSLMKVYGSEYSPN